ncbi:RND transporter [Synechococcus sp. WH 8020]|uniref:efflux RND transporter periplasmic adaptor subunit n=1 Tax=Synechococcus sp. (strain WH8020) TaxID=32052 RepID=UPI0006527EDE|nr:efflux RND transporter periplasmic adaptor subunit [Synechococcus sp. WH 8020]AKN61261.1 RND transporter [Synechococcus sp. WH 8020]
MLRFRPLLPVLLTAMSISACGGSDEQTPVLPVQQASVLEATFTDDIDTVSTLEANELVELAAQTTGRVTEIKVSQGDRIDAGQLLVVLDQVQERAALAEQRAKAATAKVDWEREEFLAKAGAASLRQRDSYRTRYVAAVEKVKALEAQLSYSNLRSPTAGTVANVQVKVGDVVTQNQPFTSVVQNNILEAKVEVPAVYGDRLAIGQPVILSVPGTVKPLATSQIESIDPQVNPQTQGLLVKALFNNDDGQLRSGQRLRTRVQLKSGQQISVPFAAVTQTSGQSFVFRVGSFADLKANPGKSDIERISQGIERGKLPENALFALQTPVNIGQVQNNRYPVTKGLKLNEKVITSNLLNLKHGMPIQVKTQRAGSQPAAAKN